MAITFVGANAWVAGTGNITPTIHASAAAGDMMLCRVGTKPYNGVNSMPAGWVSLGTFADGTIPAGNGTGSMKVEVFWKEHDGSEANPLVSNATNNSSGACIAVYRKGATETWVTPVSAGSGDTVANTTFSVSISGVSVTAGDMVDFFYAVRDNTTCTVPNITQTGVTFAAVVEAPATALISTAGGDMSADGGYRLATAGTSTGNGNITGTISTSETGSGRMTRLRAAAAPIIEQKAFRFRDDSVALNTDTWTYALNTDLTAIDVDSDVTLRLRVLLQNDGTAAMPSTSDYQLHYQVNGGGYTEIGAGTGVDTALSANYANGDATTQLLGSGSFATGDGVEGDEWVRDRALAATYETEHEWAIQLTSAELSNGDVIDFRVVYRQDLEALKPADTVTQTPSITVTKTPPQVGLFQRAYRIRSDVTVGIDAATGWAAAEDTAANINIEEPFRIRFGIEEETSVTGSVALKFQYRHDDGGGFGSWTDLWFYEPSTGAGGGDVAGPLPDRNVAAVEIVHATGTVSWGTTSYANGAYAHDAATTKILAFTPTPDTFTAGSGIEGANDVTAKSYDGTYSEHEIMCVIHRFWSATTDGTDINEVGVGDDFEFRIVESDGTVFTGYDQTPSVNVTRANGLIGGTYAESPHRAIVADVNGNLYTMIETMEKQALPMMMKSTDDGVTWEAMDVANAPGTADLEGFDMVVDNTTDIIHILVQGGDLRYLQFYTSAHASADTWNLTVGNESVDTAADAGEQSAVLIHRPSTGDLVAVYGADSAGVLLDQRIYYSVRASDAATSQTWGTPTLVDDNSLQQNGVVAVLGENEDIHIFIAEDTEGGNTVEILYWAMDTTQTLTNSGTAAIITGLDDGGTVRTPMAAPVKYMDGTKEVVMLAYSDGPNYPNPLATMSLWRTNPASQTYGTAQTKQTVSTLNGYVGGNNSRMAVFFLANQDTDVYLFWVEDDDTDVWDTLYRTLNEDEAGWGSDTSMRVKDANRAGFTMLRGTVYNDGSDDIVGYIIDNSWARNGGTGGLEYGSFTLPAAGFDKSGSGAITSTASVTATGSKGAIGTATITATANVTATGTALEFHSGSAAIAASHTVTATGDAVEFHSGSASIIATHTATAAGDAAEFHSGSGTIGSSSSVTASGIKAAEGDASVTSTSNVTASGVAVEFHAGSGSISSTAAVDAVGVSARAGTATVTSVGVLTATGVKSDTDDRSGSGAIASTADVTATGVKAVAGTASISATAGVTATGVKGAQGATSIASTATLTATGVRDDGTNDKSGSGAITSTAGVTASGVKGAVGVATIDSTATVVASGVAVEHHSGTGSISSTSSVTASGIKNAEGAASIAATASVTATGVKAEGSDDRSGSGSIASTATLTAAGTSARFGTASVASTGAVTATGVKDDSGNDKFGFGAITSTATITATGVAFFAAGAGTITSTSSVTATGTKNATGTATIASSIRLLFASGVKDVGGVGAIDSTVTFVTSAYMWIILEAGVGRGMTDDGQAPGHTDDGGEPGITDDGTQPGQTNALHSIGTTS